MGLAVRRGVTSNNDRHASAQTRALAGRRDHLGRRRLSGRQGRGERIAAGERRRYGQRRCRPSIRLRVQARENRPFDSGVQATDEHGWASERSVFVLADQLTDGRRGESALAGE